MVNTSTPLKAESKNLNFYYFLVSYRELIEFLNDVLLLVQNFWLMEVTKGLSKDFLVIIRQNSL